VCGRRCGKSARCDSRLETRRRCAQPARSRGLARGDATQERRREEGEERDVAFSIRVEAAGLAIRAIVVAALPRCTVMLAAPRASEVPSASLVPFAPLGCTGPSPCCLAAEHGNGPRRPRLPSGRTLALAASPSASLGIPRLASPRLVSPRLVSPHLISPELASLHLTSARPASPCLASPRLTSPHLTSPHLTSPHLTSSRLASPRLASSHLVSPRLTSPRLACSRPRRASVSYIALAFVLIISNGAAARERNARRSNADARHYVPSCCASHVRALRV